MISTTRDWKVALGCYNVINRDRLAPMNDVKIEYDQTDMLAQNAGTESVNSSQEYSKHTEVLDTSIDYTAQAPLATLEHNEWILNETFTLSTGNEHCGWVSGDLSSASNTFTTNPKLTLSWTTSTWSTIPGITVNFSTLLNEFATDFTVTAYLGSTQKGQLIISENTKASVFIDLPLSSYDRIEVEITKWCLPNRFARVESIVMGLKVYILKDDIISLEQGTHSDLLSFTLPDDYVTFDIDNSSNEWNPDTPKGRYAYLTERQKVVVMYASKCHEISATYPDGYEWITAGTYYTSEWTTPQNGFSASFTARALTDFMNTEFSPSSITGYVMGSTISLKELADAAFEQANLPINDDGTDKWSIDDSLDDYDVVIPNDGTNYTFNYTCGEVVQLCANASMTLLRPDVYGNIHIQKPEEDISDYYIDRFVSYKNGEYKLSKALKQVNINNGYEVYEPSETESTGVEQSITNELIQDTIQAESVAEWISDVLIKRRTISGDYRADPRVQPLDIVTNVNKFATNTVYLTDITIKYNGAFRGTYEGRVLRSVSNESLEGLWYSGEISSNGEY